MSNKKLDNEFLMSAEEHIDYLKGCRRFHLEEVEKLNIELIGLQENDLAEAEDLDALRNSLVAHEDMCRHLDGIIEEEETQLKKINSSKYAANQPKKTVKQKKSGALVKPLTDNSFNNKQLALFQSFYANTDEERDSASNTIELWDSVPRYSISRQAMHKMRDSNGLLGLLKVEFMYKQARHEVVIQPALIEDELNGATVTTAYYPSANEELIEEALRKIATIQNQGFHEQDKRSGVVFTLYQLREELKLCGHTRSYSEIVQSLNILSKSNIELRGSTNRFAVHNYFTAMVGVSKWDLAEDQNAKWYVEFHPLVAESLDKLTYRQINYKQLMSHSTQLARWLQRYLVNKYTMASKMKPFEMRYSTIKRDSAMLNNYSQERDAINACDFSINELEKQKIAHEIKREVTTGARGKILDVVYTITPTLDFITEVKAANARKGQLKNQ